MLEDALRPRYGRQSYTGALSRESQLPHASTHSQSSRCVTFHRTGILLAAAVMITHGIHQSLKVVYVVASFLRASSLKAKCVVVPPRQPAQPRPITLPIATKPVLVNAEYVLQVIICERERRVAQVIVSCQSRTFHREDCSFSVSIFA